MSAENAVASTGKIYYSQIDALKGIAIFLVVLGHGIILYPIDLHQNDVCEFVFRWLSSVHMPLFFMISGFCFSYRGSYGQFIWKKVKRLLIPYFVFNILDLIPRYLFPSLVNRPRGIAESVHKIIFDGGELWFLYTLFIIFLVYPFIYRLIKRSVYLFAGTLVLLLIVHFVWTSVPVFRLGEVIYYLFYFTIGVMVKEYLGKNIFDVKLGRLKTVAATGTLLMLWLILLELNSSHLGIIAALIGIFTLYISLQYGVLVQIFSRFGPYSLQIYLLNGFLLVISRTTIVSILQITNPFAIIVFNMLVDFFLSYIIIKYICAKLPPVRILMGMT